MLLLAESLLSATLSADRFSFGTRHGWRGKPGGSIAKVPVLVSSQAIMSFNQSNLMEIGKSLLFNGRIYPLPNEERLYF